MVQQVRSERKVSYAEAVKVIEKESSGGAGVNLADEPRKEMREVNTEKLVLFVAYVINCTDQVSSKRDKVKVIMKAAGLFLNMKDLPFAKIWEGLNQREGNEQGSQGIGVS